MVIEHDLPGRDQLERIARGIATEAGELPEGEGLTAVFDAAAGLTRVEAENALSLSLVRHNRVTPDVLWELKAQTLKKPPQQNLWVRSGSGRRPRLCSKSQFCHSRGPKSVRLSRHQFHLVVEPLHGPCRDSPRARNQFRISGR